MDIRSLMPSFLRTLIPYESPNEGAPEGTVWLNTNEYPTATKYEMRFETLNRYPQVQPDLFRTRYAQYAGVGPEEVLVTRGADEGIELIIRTFCTPFKDTVLYALPTYSMYGISAKTCGANVLAIEAKRSLALDTLGLCKALAQNQDIKVVFLCNPNNPTGTTVSRDSIIRVLEAAKDAIVAVDEAYIEFCPQATVVDLIKKYPNLAVIRTLSKAFALAGLRCGMILAQQNLIAALRKVIAPYPVPEPVAAIAARALSEGGIAAMRQRVELIRVNRAYLKKSLTKIPGVRSVYPSQTNFVLFEVDEPEKIYKGLWEKGVAIREPGFDKGVLRVSVGTIGECELFIDKLTEVLQGAGS